MEYAEMSPVNLPPTAELFTRRQLAERHAHLLSDHRVAWAMRFRHENGLVDAGGVFDSPCGETLIHEPTFLRWFLGLQGLSKPRRLRKRKAPLVAGRAMRLMRLRRPN
jgi:hypothetical protein